MHDQRRTVMLLRWVMFIALGYLMWASGGGTTGVQIGLLAVVAASNVALGRLSPGLWEHPALLPVIAALDIGVLTGAMLMGLGFARDFFFAYFVLLAVIAMLPTLRWATLATTLLVLGYGAFLSLQEGWALVQAPALMGRLGFLFTVGVGYGGLMEAGKVRLREAAMRGQLVGWVGKLSAAFSDEFDAFDVIRQILLDVQNIYPAAVRASVVQVRGGQMQVIGSSDDPELRELHLDPERYPELLSVIERGEPLVVSDIHADPETAAVRALLSDLGFSGLLLCPVNLNDADLGHVVLRVARRSGAFTPGMIRTTQHVADAIGVIFRQARVRDTVERSERMEMVSQITTSVAHSFNGILSTVLLATESLRREVIRREACDDEGRKKFESIDLAVKEGLTIVERLAAWTRLGKGGMSPEEGRGTVLEPARLLEEAWRYARPQWVRRETTRDLQLRLDVQETRSVIGRAAELREVLLNLMANAIDAMPKGGVMTLGIEEIDDRVCFSVSDTGVGMSEEQLARAFEPLYTTKGSAGTGLGLSIARSVAHRHAGEITADSGLGVGSRFRLWLPATDAPASEIAPASGSGNATGTGAGADRVLLVDANELVRDVMVRFLQALGLEVDTVASPDEAEVMVRTGRGYTGILVDAGSTAGRAETFLSALEGADGQLASRVLFYSTRALSPELQALRGAYGFGFVDRSAGLAALTDALSSHLGRPSAGTVAAA